MFAGSSINLGASGVSLSGGFQSLTVYSASGPGGESTGLVVQGASLALADALTLKLDMEYNAAPLSLRFAGSLKLPVGGVEVEAAGKLTDDGGKPSVGLFAIAKNLPPIPVAPAVFMNEIGGGFFINPTAADITMVQSLAQFQKPEMNDELQDRLPGGKKSSSTSFALMVLGGFYVTAESLLSGRALLTLTGGYLDLQAEAQAAGGLADGRGSLTISWKPWYGEGSLSVAVGFPSSGAIVSGKGDASFYVYEGVWGVTGKVGLSLLGGSLGQTELFLGTPGFMVQAGLSRSIDLYIISGSLTLKGMFWYYAPKDNIGAYASIEADGDFLGGLFSASAGLEGALIVNPGVFLYAVGHVSAEALGVTLYSGSVWVSLGSGGLDGGKGRNHQYDQMIADAKGMAAALKQAKQALIASLQDAKLKLAELDAESRKVAGLALVEQQQSIFYGFPVDWIFAQAEVGNWGPAGLPPPIKTSYDRLFGAVAKNLVAQHKALTTKLGQINTELAELEELRQQVSARLAQYEDILLADLPAVAELGSAGQPVPGLAGEDRAGGRPEHQGDLRLRPGPGQGREAGGHPGRPARAVRRLPGGLHPAGRHTRRAPAQPGRDPVPGGGLPDPPERALRRHPLRAVLLHGRLRGLPGRQRGPRRAEPFDRLSAGSADRPGPHRQGPGHAEAQSPGAEELDLHPGRHHRGAAQRRQDPGPGQDRLSGASLRGRRRPGGAVPEDRPGAVVRAAAGRVEPVAHQGPGPGGPERGNLPRLGHGALGGLGTIHGAGRAGVQPQGGAVRLAVRDLRPVEHLRLRADRRGRFRQRRRLRRLGRGRVEFPHRGNGLRREGPGAPPAAGGPAAAQAHLRTQPPPAVPRGWAPQRRRAGRRLPPADCRSPDPWSPARCPGSPPARSPCSPGWAASSSRRPAPACRRRAAT